MVTVLESELSTVIVLETCVFKCHNLRMNPTHYQKSLFLSIRQALTTNYINTSVNYVATTRTIIKRNTTDLLQLAFRQCA